MKFEIRTRDKVLVAGTLNEAICPNTINEMLKKGEFNTMLVRLSDRLIFKVQIRAGYEKPKKSFKANDVAFDPAGQWFIVFLKDATEQRGLNPIGTADLVTLELARPGTLAKLLIIPLSDSPG